MSKGFSRICPGCGLQLFYTIKGNRDRAVKKGIVCRKCDDAKRSKRMQGEGNQFFGKTHTKETIAKIQENRDGSYYKSDAFKKKMSKVTSGSKNAMYGKNVYSVWLSKYGKEEADKRFQNMRKKCSIKSSGKNNPMYGKPSPQGSGNGWSGWYKGWYFRSLKELSFMIRVIEGKGYSWKSAETRDLSILYIDHDGTERTYRADFVLDNSILVEVKPIKLFNTPNNTLKKNAAIKFCNKHGYQYRIVDIKLLDRDVLASLYRSGIIKFTKKYTVKMESLLCKLAKKKK